MEVEAMTETVKQATRRLARFMLGKGYQPEALHEYTDCDGFPLYWRIRLKHPLTREKWIRPMKHDGMEFILGEPEFKARKPLYRLHQLHQRPSETVYLVEGEQCADALEKLGLLATTSGAADSFEKADWQPLAAREVRIWPDNDEAGQRYAHGATLKLEALGCLVRRLAVDQLELAAKGDCVDWLAANAAVTAADISALPTITQQEELERNETDLSIYEPQPEPKKVPVGDSAIIARLASLSSLEYDRVRKDESEALGVRTETLDKLVRQARATKVEDAPFDDVKPWPQPIDPAQLLDDISAVFQRFIICQPETTYAAALWVAMTWVIDVVQVAPLAVITAPEKRCGKSQLLFLLAKMVKRPLSASNITPAALFRSIDLWAPTLLIDEADAFMKENEELRGLLNCGHTRESAYTVRLVGDEHTPKRFNVWGAKALAGIGHLADTLMDRAITLELRRKLPHEQVDRLRYAEPGLFDAMRAKLARFADDYAEAIGVSRPNLPMRLNDRAQDNWEPLLAIADVAGGKWPELATAAALKLSAEENANQSIGVELLADIREVFEHKRVDRLPSADLLKALKEDELKPWATYNRGKEMSPRQLAKRLGEYGVQSRDIRFGYGVRKGYDLLQFEDAFSRYLAAPPGSATTLHSNSDGGFSVADHPQRCGNTIESATPRPLWSKACSVVADKKPGAGEAAPFPVHGSSRVRI